MSFKKDRKSSKKAPPSGRTGGAFVFKDRSGKVHTVGGGRRGADDAPVESAQGKRSFKPAGRPAPEGRFERKPERSFEKPFEKKKSSGGKKSGKRFEERANRDSERHAHGKKGGKKFGASGRDDRRPHGKPHGKKKFDRDSRGGRRESLEGMTRLKATVDKNRKGFAFLLFENKREYEDAFLNPREAERFFHGDRVEAVINEDGEVMELTVIAHRFRELVGRYYPAGKNGMVVYERKRAREEIQVEGSSKGAKSRDWVRAKIHFQEEGFRNFTAEILEVYGPELPPSADIQMVAAEYNLIEEHSEAAVEEAKAFTLDTNDPDRVDLQHVPFITIDGETARDFDDAIYVERERDGHILWVAIADVSHYVTEGTALNDEAHSRGTSVYFPERAFHMLPRELSENLCSLKPREPRLTMVAKMHYDKQGRRTSTEVMNAVIFSQRRATYTEIQAEWEANGENSKWEYAPHFELYQKIRKSRADRGSIDFDLPEAEVRVQPTGEPISIKNRPRLDAHRLIEEFMIAANEAVTEYALERKWPYVYRVHEEPAFKALDKFQDLCANSGVNFVLNRNDIAGSLNEFIRSLDGNPAQTLLNMALLRSMPQAMYSHVYGVHFGLASEGYTHFTSPIRRYPDLIVHRILKEILKYEKAKKKLSDSEREEWEEKLAEITEHCSYRERIASDAERESIKLKQVRIMLPEVGNEFQGKINGMMDAGMFIVLQDPFVEGLVNKESMTDDFYEFNEERMQYVGKRKKRIYRIGDPVWIRVERVDIDLRTIDFTLIDAPTAGDGAETA